MKIINQSHEVIDRNSMTPTQLIELGARTCWASTDKIREGSDKAILKSLVGKGHMSPLEHATVALLVPFGIYKQFEPEKFINCTGSKAQDRFIISGNLRAFYEIFNVYDSDFCIHVESFLSGYCPELFNDNAFKFPELGKIKILNESDMAPEEKEIHAYRSIMIVTGRDVSHEVVRHRNDIAISQESQRYVAESGDIQFIEPVRFHNWSARQKRIFENCCLVSEAGYHKFREEGGSKEDARKVLSNSTRTKLMLSANVAEWWHIFNLRISKGAYPETRALTQNVYDDFQGRWPELF